MRAGLCLLQASNQIGARVTQASSLTGALDRWALRLARRLAHQGFPAQWGWTQSCRGLAMHPTSRRLGRAGAPLTCHPDLASCVPTTLCRSLPSTCLPNPATPAVPCPLVFHLHACKKGLSLGSLLGCWVMTAVVCCPAGAAACPTPMGTSTPPACRRTCA